MTGPYEPPSKSQVDSAGRVLRAWVHGVIDNGQPAAPFPEEVVAAFLTLRAYLNGHIVPAGFVHTRLMIAVRGVAPDSLKEIGGREKTEISVLFKLYKLSYRVTQIEDLWGWRVVLPDQEKVYAVRDRLREAHGDLIEHDYVEKPQTTGYRALHVVMEQAGRLVEIQLRTPKQNEWADTVEKTGDRLGYNRPLKNLKDGQGPADLVEYFRQAATKLACEERGEPLPAGFLADFDQLRAKARPYFTNA